ncbi:MAG TPA: DUF4328 domain-containing protein [Propionicimonas sp.]|nr:DUF4328 domain-containing protein [Propionicimonas sp.]
MRLTQPPAAEWKPEATAEGPAGEGGDPAWAAYPRVSVPAPLAATVGTSQLLPDGFARVGRAVQVLLGLCGVASLATVGFELWGLSALSMAAGDDFSSLGLYGDLSTYFSFGPAGLTAITGVLWLAWQHRLAAAVPRRTLRRSPGWHVGSWFIPVASLWFPFQNMADLHRAVTPGPGGERTPPAYRLWWGTWVAGTVAQWMSRAALQGETTLAAVTQAAAANTVGETLNAGSAVFAVLVVGDLTRRAVQARNDAVAESELR